MPKSSCCSRWHSVLSALRRVKLVLSSGPLPSSSRLWVERSQQLALVDCRRDEGWPPLAAVWLWLAR